MRFFFCSHMDAELVEHVTFSDGTVMTAGSTFNKKWLVRNVGQIPWSNGVTLKVGMC